jgi:TolB-like protein/DNA-binding SARP family transcriptional activator/Tfp pilus assembly protein PilF
MIALQLLGSPSIHRDDGLVTGSAAQRLRVALLSLLAFNGERGLSRDKLIAYLWPDADAERGRHLLSHSVYVLRQSLGADAILGMGDALRLNPERVRSDVADFQEAIAAADCERAVPLYSGPFLDGFFISDAEEFERWATARREELARAYRDSVEQLAEASEAAADWCRASTWWRRLAAEDPYNGRVALRLMQALARAGDAAGAIQHAELHSTLLREELLAAPSAGVVELATLLRQGADSLSSGRRPAPANDSTSAREAAAQRPDVARAVTAPEVAPVVRAPRRRRVVTFAVGCAGAVFLALVALSMHPGFDGRRQAVAAGAIRSLAVLPLTNDTGDSTKTYFADAMTDALITELARDARLAVISRTSVMRYRRPDTLSLPVIARDLHVDVIVEGSVFRQGDSVRITVQLIRADDDHHLWADSYQGSLRDILALQTRIARAVSQQIGIRLAGERQPSPLVQIRPVNPAAYDAYLQGRFAGRSGGGTRALRRAIELDPEFPLPYAALAEIYANLGFFGFLPPDSAYETTRRLATEALSRDETIAEAHGALAMVFLHHDWNWPAAEKEFRRAIALSPSDAYLHHVYAHYLLAMGRRAESSRETAKAAELDPLNSPLVACAGWHALADRQTGQAIEESLRALRIEPGDFWAEMVLGWAYQEEGRHQSSIAAFRDAMTHSGGSSFALAALANEYAVAGSATKAEDALVELLHREPAGYVSAYDVAGIYAGLGRKEDAVRWLERAYRERSSLLVTLAWEPRFAALRSDPRVQRLIHRMGLSG